jgi:hypothetical protein
LPKREAPPLSAVLGCATAPATPWEHGLLSPHDLVEDLAVASGFIDDALAGARVPDKAREPPAAPCTFGPLVPLTPLERAVFDIVCVRDEDDDDDADDELSPPAVEDATPPLDDAAPALVVDIPDDADAAEAEPATPTARSRQLRRSTRLAASVSRTPQGRRAARVSR